MKKHVKLYNRVWEALHADDKFVLTLDKTHGEVVKIMAEAIRKAHMGCYDFATYANMAEAALLALQSADDAPEDGARSTTRRFRKKPIVIEAFQLGRDPLPTWFLSMVFGNKVHLARNAAHQEPGIAYADIETLEGEMRANNGDWIVKGVKDEIYPVKPDIFAETYEAVA